MSGFPGRILVEQQAEFETTRYQSLPLLAKIAFIVLCTAGVGCAVFYIFGFSIGGVILVDKAFYFFLIASFISSAYLILPMRKKDKRLPWYDCLAAVSAFGIAAFFYFQAANIVLYGWVHLPLYYYVLALMLCLLVLETGRRMGGNIYALVCIVLGLYPIFAGYMPGILWGVSSSPLRTVGLNALGGEGLIGMPSKIIGDILIGFLLFAGILLASGAGKFFLDLALALCGRFRGGPAKVAVISSAFFGSLSGSVMSNIVSTGSFTIPAMKRTGYPAHYAGAIEACASTGGVIMPPVMGAIAFVMAAFLNIDYANILMAAAIPSILYYFGLLLQVDAYAAKNGLLGLPREQCPPVTSTLKKGWPFVFVLVFLIWGLVYMHWEMMTPYYATGLLLILSFHSRETLMTPKRIVAALTSIGKLITQSVAIIMPVGFVISGLTVTGVGASFTAGLVTLGEGNIFLILIMGVAACYIMGMAGMVIAAYIFLAVTLAPAVIEVAQLNVLAVHLFIIYYTMLAVITPPVAGGAFIAAAVAGAPPMKTAYQSMRIGVMIYFIPFFFIFSPSLILQGPILETIYLLALCLLGIVVIAGGMEGYLLKVGKVGILARPFLVIAGVLIAFPDPNWWTTIIGAVLAAFVIAIILVKRRVAA